MPQVYTAATRANVAKDHLCDLAKGKYMTKTLLKWERHWWPPRPAGALDAPIFSTGFVGVALEFKWRDLWLGAYIDPGLTSHVWVCLLPMLPIHFWWRRALTQPRADNHSCEN